MFHDKLKPILYENIFKNKDKLSEKLNNLTREFINLKGNEVFNKNLSQLFTYDEISNFSNKFAKSTSKLFRKNASIYKIKIENFYL